MKKYLNFFFTLTMCLAMMAGAFLGTSPVKAEDVGAISGYVIDSETSLPIENLRVSARTYDTYAPAGIGTTSANGSYTIPLPAGNYILYAGGSANGSMYALEFYDNTYSKPEAEMVVVSANNTTPGIDFSLQEGGTISGTITDETTSLPITGLHVRAYNLDTGQLTMSSITLSGGQYSIIAPPGTYRVETAAFIAGLNYLDEYYDSTYNPDDATPLTVVLGGNIPGTDFSLVPATEGTISGNVTSTETGLPIDNLRVMALNYDDGEYIIDAYTNDNGNYTLILPPGTYSVKAGGLADGLKYVSEFHDDEYSRLDANPVEVTASTHTSGINFDLQQGGTISGTVIDEATSQPIFPLYVWAYDYATGERMPLTRTAPNGSYSLILPDGNYIIQTAGYIFDLDYADEYYDDTYVYEEATPVAVTVPDDTPNINFSLAPPATGNGTITGKVIDSATGLPIDSGFVSAWDYDTFQLVTSTSVNATGDYTLEVPPGNYKVRGGGLTTSGKRYVFELYDNKYSVPDADMVVVTAGNVTPNINFSLQEGGTISGTVIDATTSLPLGGLLLSATDNSTGQHIGYGETISNGKYIITVPTGNYTVRTSAWIRNMDYADKYYDDTYIPDEATPIAVTVPNDTPDINFSLVPTATGNGTISGNVTRTDTGLPIANLRVMALNYDDAEYITDAYTDSNGNYTMVIVPGTYSIKAGGSANGLRYVDEFYDGEYSKPNSTPVTVTALGDTPDINFSLQEGGNVSGTVTDEATSLPIFPIYVGAYDYETGERMPITRTIPNGNYSLTLPSGNYVIQTAGYITGLDYADEYYDDTYVYEEATPVAVTIAETTPNINFSLAPSATGNGTITGNVVCTENGLPISYLYVSAWDYDTFEQIAYGATDASGNYTLEVPPDNYIIYAGGASDNGSLYALEFYDNTTSKPAAEMVVVSANTNTPNINFSLQEGGTISGTVTDETTSLPITGLHVRAFNLDTGQRTTSVVTNYGSYSIIAPPGNYRVETAAFIAGLDYADEYYDNVYNPAEATPVPVTLGEDTPDIDFSLASAATESGISGNVTCGENGLPIAGLPVYVRDYDTLALAATGQTGASGNYTLLVPAGNYLVDSFGVSANGSKYAREFYDNKYSRPTADMVVVSANATTPNIDFNLQEGGTISGTVTDAATSQHIPFIYLRAQNIDTGQYTVITWASPSGNYSLIAPPGTYRMETAAWISGHNYADEYYDDTYESAEATQLTVVLREDIPDINFSLLPTYDTPAGQDVQVYDPYNEVRITFNTVTEGGDTLIIATDEEPAPTTGFEFLDTYYDISTSANYSGNISVMFTYDDTGMSLAEEEALRLYHWTGAAWDDVTLLPVDTDNNQIYGTVSSLSWFAIGSPRIEGALVRLLDSQGQGIAGGTVQYYDGGWQDFGVTDTNGEVAMALDPKSYNFRMAYGFASIDLAQNIALDPVVTFQTTNVSVRLQTSTGSPLDTGTVKYYAGGWRDFGTTANGTVSKELLPKSYNFRMAYDFASKDLTQNVSRDPVVTFQTTNVNVRLQTSTGSPLDTGTIKYYAGGWQDFGTTSNGTASKELLAQSYNFRMTYGSASKDLAQNVELNPVVTFRTTDVTVQLKDSYGNPQDMGTVQYYAGGWRDFGPTYNGTVSKELLPQSYNFRMNYGFASIDMAQNIELDPVVVFQTTNVSVKLQDSSGNPLDTGTVQFYAGGWRTFGTTINGTATNEPLPRSYNFRMTYGFASNDLTQNIDRDPVVIFPTGQVISESGSCTHYYAGGWREFTNGQELLPQTYTFRFNDGTPDTEYEILAGIVNDIH